MNNNDYSKIDSIEFHEYGHFGPTISTRIYKEMGKFFYNYVYDNKREVSDYYVFDILDDYSSRKADRDRNNVIELSQKEWEHVVKHIINHYKILDWKENYVGPYILDGTNWSFSIVENEKEIKSGGGSNAFPEKYSSLMNYLLRIEDKALRGYQENNKFIR